MKKVEFMKYETPVVEIIEVEVEKGFAASPVTGGGQTDGFGEED